MEIQRVVIVFDTTLRPETAGVYCQRALERIVESQHFQPHELERMPRTGFDLYLNIDDGLRYHLPPDCRPSAFWAIDTYQDFDRCREKALRFDLVIAAQRDGVDLLRGIGVRSASWLPLACDPGVHRKHDDVAKQYDVAFEGGVFPGPRGELLGLIQRRYRNSFVGQRDFDEMARTYSAARIAFNRSIREDVNMRVFEAVACGSMLMTNDLRDNGLAELFRDGVQVERSATHAELAEAGGEERAVLGSDGGLHPPYGNACPDPFYFGYPRPEVVALVPETARRVLDVGCGAGRLGEAIRQPQTATVSGIELDAQAAAGARERLDLVWAGDIEQLDLEIPPGSFDAIICADVLEHLHEPSAVLERIRWPPRWRFGLVWGRAMLLRWP